MRNIVQSFKLRCWDVDVYPQKLKQALFFLENLFPVLMTANADLATQSAEDAHNCTIHLYTKMTLLKKTKLLQTYTQYSLFRVTLGRTGLVTRFIKLAPAACSQHGTRIQTCFQPQNALLAVASLISNSHQLLPAQPVLCWTHCPCDHQLSGSSTASVWWWPGPSPAEWHPSRENQHPLGTAGPCQPWHVCLSMAPESGS